MRCAARARRGILFLHLALAILWFFTEGIGVKLPGEIFDCRDDPRRGPINSLTDHRKAAMADGIHDAPAWKGGERLDGRGSRVGMRIRENQEVGLQPGDFFEADLRPVLFGVHDGNGPCPAQGIRDKSALANGDEWLTPDNEQDTLWR